MTGKAQGRTDPDGGREQTAERLLRSNAQRSYDPELEIDWSAPPVAGLGYLREERCSLYGTALWRSLSPGQRLELGKHEAASVASVGIWLEFLLMRMLTKLSYENDPASRHIQYALAEIADGKFTARQPNAARLTPVTRGASALVHSHADHRWLGRRSPISRSPMSESRPAGRGCRFSGPNSSTQTTRPSVGGLS